MKKLHLCNIGGLMLGGLAWAMPSYASSLMYGVSLDTSPLAGHPAQPFYLEFQLNDGGGGADNTVTLSDFDFGGGAAVGSPTLTGGVVGDLDTQVVLSDSAAFFNEFYQQFNPGGALSFVIQVTDNIEVPPDVFTFALLDSTLTELPTQGFADVFLELEISSTPPQITTYASDSSVAPDGGGSPISIAAPTVSVSQIPEPTSLALMLAGCGVLFRFKPWLRK